MAFSKGFKVLAAIAILGGIGFLAAIFWGELNKNSASTTSDMTVPTTVPTIVQSSTGFDDGTTSSSYTRRVLPTSIETTFCPAVLAELMASVQDRSSDLTLYIIANEGSDSFSDASLRINRTKTNNQKIDSLIREFKTKLNATRDLRFINAYLPMYVKNITEATNASAILADETLQIFLRTNQIIQDSLSDFDGASEFRNQWQNLTSFFRGFADLASSANSKWQKVRNRTKTVIKDLSQFNETLKLVQAAEFDRTNMKNVTVMYLDISIKEKFAVLPYLYNKDQTLIEKGTDLLWDECEQSSNRTMALMTYLQRALSNVSPTTISSEVTTTDYFDILSSPDTTTSP